MTYNIGTASKVANGLTASTGLQIAGGLNTFNGSAAQSINVDSTVWRSGITNTNSSQPAFFAYLGSTAGTVTGDGTSYQIAYSATTYDNTSSFTTGASAHFTAPTAGTYLFTGNITTTGLTTNHTDYLVQFYVNSNQFQFERCYPFPILSSSGSFTSIISALPLKLAVNDSVRCYIQVSNGTKVVSVSGGSSSFYPTWFSGVLLC